MNWNPVLLPSAYCAFFALSAFAILWWERRKRSSRSPFPADLRLTRGPGEEQLKVLNRLDDDFLFLLLAAAVTPCLLAVILLEGVRRLPGWWMFGGLLLVGAAFLAAYGLAARRMVTRLRERGDRYLGYVGERVVAEELEPLKSGGWAVYHDVPCDNGPEKFKIDHVAVGPGGVFAIETDTRRKGAPRAGREDYKVFFDGDQLSWPWGEDQQGITRALRNAQWLEHWLRKVTGEKLDVTPVLALPGWTVEAPANANVHVVSPSWLPAVLAGDHREVLSGREVELCGRQLQQRCRDVAV
ncbi:MAG TPA: nuclease-related domain-containing protein [Opitutaceae bacterium]|nr:nuclease-related domain-containing protein [Opitutaceae bacterium]